MNPHRDVRRQVDRHAVGFLEALDQLAMLGDDDAPVLALLMAEKLALRLGATLRLETVPDSSFN